MYLFEYIYYTSRMMHKKLLILVVWGVISGWLRIRVKGRIYTFWILKIYYKKLFETSIFKNKSIVKWDPQLQLQFRNSYKSNWTGNLSPECSSFQSWLHLSRFYLWAWERTLWCVIFNLGWLFLNQPMEQILCHTAEETSMWVSSIYLPSLLVSWLFLSLLVLKSSSLLITQIVLS